MSEIIEIRKEQMLPEYEEMKKLEYFNDQFIRDIMKKREAFEYKIERQSKNLKNYLEYISYEMKLLNLVKKNSESENPHQPRTHLENILAKHIKSLFKQGLGKFPEDIRLWDHMLKFCKQHNYISEAITTMEKMIQFHGDKPDVWLRAVMLEYHETQNMERVKDLFLRGLQRHPDSTELYKEFFKIMLHEASKMSTDLVLQKNTESEQSLGLERALIVYESSKKRIHNVDFWIELLNITEEFSFARKLQSRIIDDLTTKYPREEIVWDTLAQRELKGLHMSDLQNPCAMQNLDPNNQKTPKQRIDLCVRTYDAGVKELNTEKMWSCYINAMLDLNQNLATQKVHKRKVLGEAFKAAHDSGCMSEKHYIRYVELLMETNEESEYLLSVLRKATSLHYESKKLWELWMRYHINQDNEKKVIEVFRKAKDKLHFESYPLWHLLLQYYQTRPDLPNKTDDTFKEACFIISPKFSEFRSLYIEWLAMTDCVPTARIVYNELSQLPPPCLSLHYKMCLLESMQITPDITEWRKCHDNLIKYFGKERTDVWVNYIKFERDVGEPKNISKLFDRAKATLNDDLVDDFLSEHCLLVNAVV